MYVELFLFIWVFLFIALLYVLCYIWCFYYKKQNIVTTDLQDIPVAIGEKVDHELESLAVIIA